MFQCLVKVPSESAEPWLYIHREYALLEHFPERQFYCKKANYFERLCKCLAGNPVQSVSIFKTLEKAPSYSWVRLSGNVPFDSYI